MAGKKIQQLTRITSRSGVFLIPICDDPDGDGSLKAISVTDLGISGGGSSGTGTVTTVSVASANGFAGSVANATTTPAITLSTTITGLLKGNGTAISAAVSGTDYAPVNNATFTGTHTSPTFSASGLTGATAASRYVGATTSGAPVSGTFAVGDYIIDRTGAIYICTTAGTPGTWTIGGGAPVAGTGISVTGSTVSIDSTVVTLTGSQTLTNKSLTSPALTGTPTGPTAASGTNTTQLATTAFVLANSSPPGAGGGGSPVAGNGISVAGSTVSINTAVTVDRTTAQTLTNKTLDNPILTGETQVKVLGYSAIHPNGMSGNASTIDWRSGNIQSITVTAYGSGMYTPTFTAPSKPGPIVLYVTQGNSGTCSINWPASVKCAGGYKPQPTTRSGALDIIAGQFDGTNYHIAMSISDSL